MVALIDSLLELGAFAEPIHWAVGFFDGVHLGHCRVIRSAQQPGRLCGVLTFDRHPLELLKPTAAPLLLTPDAEYKADLIERAGGVDVLLRLPFTPGLAALPPAAFLDALCGACRVAGVSVGANWRFGRGGVGTADLLREEGARRGFEVRVQTLAEQGGRPVSSSCIRAELAEGRLAQVEQMLGRPFAVAGVVEHGQHLARRLGFPTANIALSARAALPPYGVYLVRCRLGGELLCGIANIGLRPTIQERVKAPRLEMHLLNWRGDLYGRRLEVELAGFLRAERAFPSVDALREQIQRDVDAARRACAL